MGRTLAFLLFAVAAAVQTAAPPDQFFDSSGVRIRYLEQGVGTPVILLHGYTGTVDRQWMANGVFAELAQDNRVIAFDLRGHGKSEKPRDPTAYGEEMARDAVRLLDHLQISRAHIVGYSLGAIVAARMVSLAPERMISAAFIGRHPQRPLSPKEVEEMDASVRELEGNMPFRSLAVGVQPPGSKPLTDDEIRRLVAPLVAANDVRALAAMFRGFSTLVIEDKALSASRVPMIEIIGTEDPNHPAALELQKAHPEIATFIVKGAQHGGEQGILRRPEAVARLREFLSTTR